MSLVDGLRLCWKALCLNFGKKNTLKCSHPKQRDKQNVSLLVMKL